MEISIQDNIRMGIQMGKGYMSGKMEAFMKENFRRVLRMGRGSGGNTNRMLNRINILDNIEMIRSMDTESLIGLLVMYIRDSILKMKGMGMDK